MVRKSEPISEEELVRIARIVGPFSAAQRALDAAQKQRDLGESVTFLRHGDTIVVVSVKPKP